MRDKNQHKTLNDVKNNDHFKSLIELRNKFKPETASEEELFEDINWAIITVVKLARKLDLVSDGGLERSERIKGASHLRLVK